MKILYIDKVDRLDNVRIAEQIIFSKILPEKDIEVDFLLLGNTQNFNVNSHCRIYFRRNTYLFKSFLTLDPIMILFYGLFLHKKNLYDIVISRKNLTTGYSAKFLCLLISKKFVFLLSFPKWEILKLKGKSVLSSIILKYFSKLYENLVVYLIKNSDLTVSKTKYLWDMISSKHHLKEDNSISIPMGFDTSETNQIEDKVTLRNKLNMNNKVIYLIYFGSIDSARDPDFIFKVFQKIMITSNHIHCILIGGLDNQIERFKIKYNLTEFSNKIIIMPNIKRTVLYDYIAASDISMSPIPPISAYKISSPTKVIESMGLGIPVIANREIFEHEEIIQDSNGGILVNYNVEEFVYEIINLANDSKRCENLSKNAKEFIINNRTYEVLGVKLLDKLNYI